VNFDLSREATDLRGEVQRFLSRESPLSAARLVTVENLTHNESIWKQVVALGWLGVAVPDEYGGSNMGYEALSVVIEQAGAALVPAPLMSTLGAIEALLLAGNHTQKKRWLPKLIEGELIGTVAIADQIGNPDPRLISAHVTKGQLSGTKRPVADGAIADLIIVVAREGLCARLYAVEADPSTLTRCVLSTLDIGRSHASLCFDRAMCEELRGDGRGWPTVQRYLDRLAMIAAFEQLGGASACLASAVAHAKQRIAFGRPIGSFQAIKHKLADIYVAIELARSNAYYGAWALTNARDEPVAASSARIAGIDAFESAARENIHIHGGQGFAWAQDCHLYFRRSRMLAAALGTAPYWKDRLIASIEQPAAARSGSGL
jgi:acyl-CoA dehydrogenase